MFTHLSVLSEKCTTVHGILYSGLPELKYSDEHACLVPNPCLYKPVQITPLFRDTLIFHKMDRFPSPTSTWAVQNSLNNVEYLHKIICYGHWTPRLDFIVTQYWTFLPSYSKGECCLIALKSPTMHCQAYQKDIRSFWTTDNSILLTHSGGFNGVCFRSTLL